MRSNRRHIEIRLKSVLLLILLCTLVIPSNAQESKPKKRKSRLYSEDHYILDITSSMWVNEPGNINQFPLRSIGYNFTVFKDLPIGFSSFSFAIGASYSISHIQNNGEFKSIVNNTAHSYTAIVPIQADYISNRFTLHWFDVPVEFRLRTKGNGPFRLYLGAKAGYNVMNYSRFKDAEQNIRTYNIKHIEKIRYGVYGRIGYGFVNFYGYYGLNTLFKANRGPQLTTATMGISLILQ